MRKVLKRIALALAGLGFATGPAEADAPKKLHDEVRHRVSQARRIQLQRCGYANSRLTNPDIDRHCRLDRDSEAFLQQALERLGLSARAYHRILKVARTIADLEAEPAVRAHHISEAIGLRRLDRRLPEVG